METKEVIRRLLKYARPEILKEFRADSCIVSTAIGLDVLTAFGVLAEPFAVRTTIFNEAFVNRIEGGSPWPKGDEVRHWTDEDGSYSVGIGVGTQQPNKWAGHLCILAEKRYLIDLSIDQATRPLYNMEFKPMCVEVEDTFIHAVAPKVFKYGPCVMRIEAISSLGYVTSPDWTFVGRRKKIVEHTIRLLKGDTG